MSEAASGNAGPGSVMWKPFASIEDPYERRLLVTMMAPFVVIMAALTWSGDSESLAPLVLIGAAGCVSMAAVAALYVHTARRDRLAWRNANPPSMDPDLARQLPTSVVRRRSLISSAAMIVFYAPLVVIPVGDSIIHGLDPWWLGIVCVVLLLSWPVVRKYVQDEVILTSDVIMVRSSRGWRGMAWGDVATLTPTHFGLAVESGEGRTLVVALGLRPRFNFQKAAFDPVLLAEIQSRAPGAVLEPPRRW